MIVEYIEEHKDRLGVEPICKVLQIAPSTYYAVRARTPSARSVTDAVTMAVIRDVHATNYGVYGVRKVHAEANRKGHKVARCTVARLMRAAGLRGISRAKGPRTTIPGTGPDTRPDLVDRKFTASGPNQLWVADITYCRTFAGWVYAAFVTDVYSRRVVGWQLSTSLRTDLALDALEMGIWTRQRDGHDITGVTHHSDKGVQGGFNRSSQHLVISEVFDGSSAAGSGSGDSAEVEVARSPEVPSRGRSRFLGRDRPGAVARRGGGRGRCVAACGSAMVPRRWRHAPVRPDEAAFGPLLVLC